MELVLHIPGKLPAAGSSAAGGEEGRATGLVLLEPAQEPHALGVAAEPVQTQFDCARLAQSSPYSNNHLCCRALCHHCADTASPSAKRPHAGPLSVNLLKIRLVSTPIQNGRAPSAFCFRQY